MWIALCPREPSAGCRQESLRGGKARRFRLATPLVVDARVVVPAAEAPGRDRAVARAEDVNERLGRVGEDVEHVLATHGQRHVGGEGDAGLEVDDVRVVLDRRTVVHPQPRVVVVDPWKRLWRLYAFMTLTKLTKLTCSNCLR